jgi:hypothetical protein
MIARDPAPRNRKETDIIAVPGNVLPKCAGFGQYCCCWRELVPGTKPAPGSARQQGIEMQWIAAIVLLLVSTGDALSTQAYCGVLKATTDGFVALRAGPGTRFRIVKRLKPFEAVWLDTGPCREDLCDETGRWKFVEAVPRIDGPTGRGRNHRFTQGWVRSNYVKEVVCPDLWRAVPTRPTSRL